MHALVPLLGAPPSAARLGTAAGGPSATGPCTEDGLLQKERLYVSSPNGQAHIFGMYVLLEGEFANHMPLWRQLGGERWLYSDSLGRWTIGGSRAREQDFQGSSGFVYCKEVHGGALPDEVGEGQWMRFDEDTKQWLRDEEITVTDSFIAYEPVGRRRKEKKGRGKGKSKEKGGSGRGAGRGTKRTPLAGRTRGGHSLFMDGLGGGPARQPPPQPQQQQQRASQGARPQRPSSSSQSAGGVLLNRGKALRCLGLKPADQPGAEEVRRAYRRAAMIWHPDRRHNHGREEEAKKRFQAIRTAYEFLQSGQDLSRRL